MADELEDPYAKRLSGSEILNILCEEKCDRLQDIKPKGKSNFESKYLLLKILFYLKPELTLLQSLLLQNAPRFYLKFVNWLTV